MAFLRYSTPFAVVLSLALTPGASGFLGDAEMKMLRDSGGWEYTKISNDIGFPTQHTCFDGAPHPDQCRGTLTLGTDDKFVKKIYIKGLPDTRQGRYKVDGNQITFFDEFDVQDGPYDLTLDTVAKTLTLGLAGQKIELMLETEYKSKNKPRDKGSQPQRK